MPLERSSYSTWAVSASCRDCENLGAQTDLDAGPGLGALPQDAFQIRLVKAVARVPALRTDFHRPGPMEQQPAAGVHEAHARRDMRVRKDGITQPNRLQDAHDFIVEMHRPGQGIRRPLALKHEDRDTAQAKQVGQGRSRRATAHDADLVPRVVHFCFSAG